MRHPLLAARIYNVPLMIAPGKMEIIERAFRAAEEGQAAVLSPQIDAPRARAALDGSTVTDSGYERTGDGVAIIQMVGPLVQRGGMNFASGGPTGYNEIASQIQAALADPRVGALLLEIDSPGGEANGAFDLQSKIIAAGKKKPTWAIAVEQAFSAAYLQASGANKLFVPAPGMVGSVGVVMLHVDQSISDARKGLVYTPIFAGARKVDFSSHAPLSEDAFAIAQEEIDRVYEMFVNAVADGRGIDARGVRDTQAALLNPPAALAAGLVDGIQSFDDTLAQLAAEAQHVRIYGMRASARTSPLSAEADKEQPMTEQEKSAQTALIAEARAAGIAEGKTAATAEATAANATAAKAATEAERKRVHAIQTCEAAKGKPALAGHLALETDMTVEQASALLAKAAAETPTAGQPANLLAAAMGKVPNPKVGADPGNDGPDAPKSAVISANELFAARRAQAGHGGKAS